MEGMIPNKLVCIYEDCYMVKGEGLSALPWASQLVVRLLEVTHGQYIYRNVQLLDEQQGTLGTREKEKLQRQIEAEMDLGFTNFLPMDRCLTDVTPDNLEPCDWLHQEY